MKLKKFLNGIEILKYNSGDVVQAPFLVLFLVVVVTQYEIKGANLSNTTKQLGDKFYLIPTSIKALAEFLNSDINPFKDRIFAYISQTDVLGVMTRLPGIGGRIDVTVNPPPLIDNIKKDVFSKITSIQGWGWGYKYHTGLVQLANRVVYGDDRDLENYPGVGAAGINFRVIPANPKKIGIDIQVDMQSGVLKTLDRINLIKAEVLEYINSLKIGETLIIERVRSKIISLNFVKDVRIESLRVNGLTQFNENS